MELLHVEMILILVVHYSTFQVGLAVQFVSNCHSSSKREAYVRELRRFIPVDIYGKCGEFKCAKEKGWQCYQEAEAKYKFYLAFENAV